MYFVVYYIIIQSFNNIIFLCACVVSRGGDYVLRDDVLCVLCCLLHHYLSIYTYPCVCVCMCVSVSSKNRWWWCRQQRGDVCVYCVVYKIIIQSCTPNIPMRVCFQQTDVVMMQTAERGYVCVLYCFYIIIYQSINQSINQSNIYCPHQKTRKCGLQPT